MIFCPDKVEVARSFRRSLTTYDDNALIQKKVSERLVGLLEETDGIDYSRVLEIGCCTGTLTEMLCSQYPVESLFVNDLVPELCEKARARVLSYKNSVETLPGDIEKVEIPRQLSLILSSSTLQWLSDYPAMLDKFAAALVVHGHLVFSLFGNGTLGEIKELTGRGLHYLSFDQICAQLEPHFVLLRSETTEDRLYFANPRDILRHLQATGVGGLGAFRWTHATLKVFENEYRRLYGNEAGLRLTYISHFLVARKK